MPITWLDGILIAIMFISAILAMIRGFAREVLSIGSWIAAAASAYFLYGHVLPYVKEYISNPHIALGVSVAAVFFVTLIVVSYITMRISDFILDSRIGVLDRTLGFAFGAGRGFLLVVVAMMFFNWFVPVETQPAWVAKAKSKPLLDTVGGHIIAALPDDPESDIFNRLRNRGKDKTANETRNDDATTADPTYKAADRKGLKRLIGATTTE